MNRLGGCLGLFRSGSEWRIVLCVDVFSLSRIG